MGAVRETHIEIIYEMDKQKNTEGEILDYLFIVKVIMHVGRLLCIKVQCISYTLANYFLATGRPCHFVQLTVVFFLNEKENDKLVGIYI